MFKTILICIGKLMTKNTHIFARVYPKTGRGGGAQNFTDMSATNRFFFIDSLREAAKIDKN